MAIEINVGDVVKFTSGTSSSVNPPKTKLGIVEQVLTISESTIPSDVSVKEYVVNTLVTGGANERVRDSNISTVYTPEVDTTTEP